MFLELSFGRPDKLVDAAIATVHVRDPVTGGLKQLNMPDSKIRLPGTQWYMCVKWEGDNMPNYQCLITYTGHIMDSIVY